MKKSILCILVVLLLPASVQASMHGRHILLVHDISKDVQKDMTSYKRAVVYLNELLFFGPISLKGDDSMAGSYEAKSPLWRSGDALTVITFGMNTKSMTNKKHETAAWWIHEFNKQLFDPSRTLEGTDSKVMRAQLAHELGRLKPGEYYSPSRYMFPFALSAYPKHLYAAETLLVTVRDYHTSTQRDGIALREMCGDMCADAVIAAQSDLATVFHADLLSEIQVADDVIIEIQRITSVPLAELTAEIRSLHLFLGRDSVSNAGPPLRVALRGNTKALTISDLGLEITLTGGKPSLWPGTITARDGQSIVANLEPFHFSGALDDVSVDSGRLYAKTITRSGDMTLPQVKWFAFLPLDLERASTAMDYISYGAAAAILLAVALWLVFGRDRKVDVSFSQAPSATRQVNGLDCHLFECDPANPIATFKLKIGVGMRPGGWNNSSKTKTSITPVVDSGDSRTINAAFNGADGGALTLTNVPRSGKIYELALSPEWLCEEDLCRVQEASEQNPFTLTLKIKTGKEESSISLHGIFVPRESNIWIGLDPGTSGSCAYAGIGHDELKPIMLNGQGDGAGADPQQIMDSVVFFHDTYTPPDLPYDPDVVVCGVREISDDWPGTLVASAKRLVGYGNTKTVEGNGLSHELSGEDVQAVLVDCMVSNALTQLNVKAINKAVVAVPNSFTPAKVELMKECCRKARGLGTVEHIYEVEAVLLYYYKHYQGDLVFPQRALVIDFGGSTLNLAVAILNKQGGDLHVEMRARLGYNLGGDTITAMVANAIWEKNDLRKDFLDKNKLDDLISGPFTPREEVLDDLEHWETVCDHLWKEAEEVKVNNNGDMKSHLIFNLPEIEELMETVSNGIREVMDIAEIDSSHPVNIVIPTGRSTLFSKMSDVIHETIDGLKESTGVEPLIPETFAGDANRKTCVAEGAAYYGVLKDTIHITRAKAFAHYGFKLYTSHRDWEFKKIIEMGTDFDGSSAHEEKTDIDVQYNNNQIQFYQVLASDPEKALREKRATLMEDFQLPPEDKILNKASLTLFDTDTYAICLDTDSNTFRSREDKHYVIEDITTEMDKFTTWRLV